jgi:hypothetical protein
VRRARVAQLVAEGGRCEEVAHVGVRDVVRVAERGSVRNALRLLARPEEGAHVGVGVGIRDELHPRDAHHEDQGEACGE